MKKILLFQMNGIAYDSTRFFSSCLGKALENALGLTSRGRR